MIKTRIILIYCLLLLMGCKSPYQQIDRPNIILFLVDDMGWQDTSVPFHSERTLFNDMYHTPSMERLADEGMIFTQAYACTVCSPSRISLMTGLNTARHRVTNWTLRKDTSTDRSHEILELPEWNVNGMSPVPGIERTVYATPLPKILQDAGYFTIHCGKAHFGAMGTLAANPLNVGFDINIAGHAAGGPGSYYGKDNFGNEFGKHTPPWGIPGLEKYHGQDIYLNEALTLEAINALDSAINTGKPFFLYMSHYAIHAPIMEDPRFYGKYLNDTLPVVESKYASMIESMDKSLGDIMKYLDERNLADNTIILFMSDNGGLSAVARGGTPHIHNKPLNSGKGSAYEGGIREPMIVKWQGVVKSGSVCEKYLIIEDFFPTILEMAGIADYETVQNTDGISFVPLLSQTGSKSPERDLFWHFPNNWGPSGPGIGTTSTIRSGEWKLIYWYKDQHFELFNIKEDIGELNNLALENDEKVRELAGKLGEFLRNANAQRPSYKENNNPAPWPDEALNE
ncbi:MAG: sulfatase [Bacteroidales bacterium]|nr:sulfatase [Bacteroidales bacterium]